MKNAPDKELVNTLVDAIASFNSALHEEVDKAIISGSYEEMVENSPADIAARYWLIEFLTPLSRKELKSIVDGFLVQMLNEDQAKKLVKFLLIRYPTYYAGDATKPVEMKPMEGAELMPGEKPKEKREEDEPGEAMAKEALKI